MSLLLMAFFTALIPASTGPLPAAASYLLTPDKFKQILATDCTPTPLVTCKYSNLIRWVAVRSFPTNIKTSSSLISFLRSASFKNSSYTLSNFSCSRSTPKTCRRCFNAARPLRAVNTIALSSIPTSFGSMIS